MNDKPNREREADGVGLISIHRLGPADVQEAVLHFDIAVEPPRS